MSVQARVDDALLLWKSGRREGAFLTALVAVAATARKRFPDRKAVGDRDAFERFLRTAHSVRLSAEYRGECHPIEHIFYKWFRCELVHEGELPIDIEFMADDDPRHLSVRAGGAPEFVLKVSESWFHHLIGTIVGAPENRDVFGVTQRRSLTTQRGRAAEPRPQSLGWDAKRG
ncbi:MAG: hypothetical protein ABR964_09415 [Tepidisphaeraceae bacterium]|jgi:hypothetical protein